MTTREYSIAFFLHGDLAERRKLQSILDVPHFLKMRKAWLPGYLPVDNSTVVKSGCWFGEWQEEYEVRGVAYFVKSDDEENILTDYTGAVEVRDADFQICAGGILGKRDWVVGKVFTSAVTEEQEEGMREERRERLEVVEDESAVKEDLPQVPRQGFEDIRTPSTTPMAEEDTDAQSEYCFKDALRLTEHDAPRISDEHISLLEAIRSIPPRDVTYNSDVRQVCDFDQETDDQEALGVTMSRVIEAGESSQQRRTARHEMIRTTSHASKKSGMMQRVKGIMEMFEKLKK
jgi:hypothetical protein